MPYTKYTSLIHDRCHILKPVAFFGKQPARLVRQGGGGGVWTDHWEWKKGWFHFLTIFRNFWGQLYVAKYIGGGVRCECIRITDGRPPRCFQNKYSIPNVLSHQHSWARKQKNIWIGFASAFCKNPDINLCNFICCHKHENTTSYGLLRWDQAESRWILTAAAALSITKAEGLIHWKIVSYLHLALPPFSGLWNDFIKTFLN